MNTTFDLSVLLSVMKLLINPVTFKISRRTLLVGVSVCVIQIENTLQVATFNVFN